MGYFPMCVDLTGRPVLLVGNGKQIEDKMEKLRPFGVVLRRTPHLCAADLTEEIALVVAGDLDPAEAEWVSGLCRLCGIPVNVVDMPAYCSFTFPSVITRGDLTVSISTGGKAPGAAGYLASQLEASIPDRTGEILDWLQERRQMLYEAYPKETARMLLSRLTREAFMKGRPLTAEEAGI